ncbi:hypothetical protein KUV26_16885 [Leisingera daeponensis]|uniref:Uncharacterized protein n=1 Tax=Leisingera daeponensis TaxID=405746 RepID=A0ABS7NK95_9RHOB|nr:hypothetical protein [Leisingera daeponensis]MBY6141114.1 hypothetical protein [Leisingera daeponensis]
MITLKRSAASKAAELAGLRAFAVASIAAATDEVRRRYITSIAGQEMVYWEKEREAAAYLAADPEPADLSAFPFLDAEAAALGLDVYQLAQIVLFKAAEWREVGPRIEALRVGFGDAAGKAQTAAELDEVLADFRQAIWEL